MEVTPRDYGERSQFDRYCKLVLQHEAIDYHREMKRLTLSTLHGPGDWFPHLDKESPQDNGGAV
jgi:hypothetical protein